MPLPEAIQEKRNALVEQVVDDIQQGKPFFWDNEHYGRPYHNIIKGASYNGANRLRLMLASRQKGFTDSRWGTYKQAQDRGWQVKKGEKGTHIEWWTYTKKEKTIDEKTGEERREEVRLTRPMVKNYVVFNAQQMDNVPPEHPMTIDEAQRNTYMENMLKNCEAKINYDEAFRNYYKPSTDEIHVMPREKFKNLDAFYATCVHEIAHSTGHAKRLNRDLNAGDKTEYAKEELRAELTSMFIAQDWGLNFDESHYESHAAYLQSWAKVLQDDPNELYRAAADAQKMSAYIEQNMILKGLEMPKDQVKEDLEKTAPKEKSLTASQNRDMEVRHAKQRSKTSTREQSRSLSMSI